MHRWCHVVQQDHPHCPYNRCVVEDGVRKIRVSAAEQRPVPPSVKSQQFRRVEVRVRHRDVQV